MGSLLTVTPMHHKLVGPPLSLGFLSAFFFFFSFLIAKTGLWGNSQTRLSRVIFLQDGGEKMDEYPSGRYNKIRK